MFYICRFQHTWFPKSARCSEALYRTECEYWSHAACASFNLISYCWLNVCLLQCTEVTPTPRCRMFLCIGGEYLQSCNLAFINLCFIDLQKVWIFGTINRRLFGGSRWVPPLVFIGHSFLFYLAGEFQASWLLLGIERKNAENVLVSVSMAPVRLLSVERMLLLSLWIWLFIRICLSAKELRTMFRLLGSEFCGPL